MGKLVDGVWRDDAFMSEDVTGDVKLPDYGRSKFPHLERMGEVLAPL